MTKHLSTRPLSDKQSSGLGSHRPFNRGSSEPPCRSYFRTTSQVVSHLKHFNVSNHIILSLCVSQSLPLFFHYDHLLVPLDEVILTKRLSCHSSFSSCYTVPKKLNFVVVHYPEHFSYDLVQVMSEQGRSPWQLREGIRELRNMG